MSDKMTDEAVKALQEDDDGSVIAIDEDGDAYLLPSGLPNNLLALPARDDGGAVLNVLQWQNMVARFNAAPDLARALLEARAECDGAHMIIATERAEVVRLRAENARLRGDAAAARALASGNGRAALDNLADIVAMEADRDRLAADLASARAQIEAAILVAGRLAYWLDADAEVLADMDSRDMSDHQHIVGQVAVIVSALAALPAKEGE